MRQASSNWFRAASFFAVVAAALPASAQVGLDRDPLGQDASAQDGLLDRELQPPRFTRLAVGPQVAALGRDGQVLGRLLDHVVDPRSGRILHGVVQLEGEQPSLRMVPAELMEWEPGAEGPVLLLGPEDLRAMPEFDAQRLRRLGSADRAAPVEPGFAEKGTDGAPAAVPGGVILASQLPGLELRRGGAVLEAGVDAVDANGGTEGLGRVNEVWLQPGRAQVALLLVGAPGQDVLVVPWQAASYRAPEAESGGRPALLLELDGARLDEAPRLEGVGTEALEDPQQLERIYGFYGLPVPVDPLPLEDPRG